MGLLYNSAKKAAEVFVYMLADGTVIDIGIWYSHADMSTWSLRVNEGRNEELTPVSFCSKYITNVCAK